MFYTYTLDDDDRKSYLHVFKTAKTINVSDLICPFLPLVIVCRKMVVLLFLCTTFSLFQQ